MKQKEKKIVMGCCEILVTNAEATGSPKNLPTVPVLEEQLDWAPPALPNALACPPAVSASPEV